MEIDRDDPAFTLVCVFDVAAAKWMAKPGKKLRRSQQARMLDLK